MVQMDRNTWDGEDLKFLITLQAEGFDMDRDDYRLVLVRGNKQVELTSADVKVEDGNHYLCLKASKIQQLGLGNVYLVAYVDVPDALFEDNVRTEIDKQLLYIARKP